MTCRPDRSKHPWKQRAFCLSTNAEMLEAKIELQDQQIASVQGQEAPRQSTE